MSKFWKSLATEVDIKLTDRRNNEVDILISEIHYLKNFQIEFKENDSDFWDGTAKMLSEGKPVLSFFFHVYILKKKINTSIFTLDFVKLLDVPSPVFISSLEILFQNKKPRTKFEA